MTSKFETPKTLQHLHPSPLGTKQYWDTLYTQEISNHAQDTLDEGTIWFDDSAAEDKIIEFMKKFIIKSKMLGEHVNQKNCSILDLGTGNGHLLFSLREDASDESTGDDGWNGPMLGVDYSEKSIEFARRIGKEKRGRDIKFLHWDIISSDPADVILIADNVNGWDVVLDKGTFDAISLSAETDVGGRRTCDTYRDRVLPLIRPNGIFLITSCNWTEEELKAWFHGPGLIFVDAIHYKLFSFGGHTGQTISSVCFQKK